MSESDTNKVTRSCNHHTQRFADENDRLQELIALKKREDKSYRFDDAINKCAPLKYPVDLNKRSSLDDGMLPVLWRQDLCRWIHKCVDYFDIPDRVEALAISYMDTFLATLDNSVRSVERTALLTALASLHLAMSLSSGAGVCISIRSLLEEVENVDFQPSDVEKMNLLILERLKFMVQPPTASEYLHYFTSLLRDFRYQNLSGEESTLDPSLREYIIKQSTLLLGLALHSSEFVRVQWHTVTFCALAVLMEYTCLYNPSAQDLCNAFLHDLGSCILELNTTSFMCGESWDESSDVMDCCHLVAVKPSTTPILKKSGSQRGTLSDEEVLRSIRIELWKLVLDQSSIKEKFLARVSSSKQEAYSCSCSLALERSISPPSVVSQSHPLGNPMSAFQQGGDSSWCESCILRYKLALIGKVQISIPPGIETLSSYLETQKNVQENHLLSICTPRRLAATLDSSAKEMNRTCVTYSIEKVNFPPSHLRGHQNL